MQIPSKEVVIPEGAAKPIAPYSPAIRLGYLVFTSGQIGIDPQTGSLVPGGIKAETKMSLKNLKAVLGAAGCSMENVVKTTIFLKDINDYTVVNKIYGQFFTENHPARSAVQVASLPAGALVEIEAIAVMRDS
jgi:2-iminobutanoate/2-iminopropanoate deaminase